MEPTQALYVDFNNRDHSGRVRLTAEGTARDLVRLGIHFERGLRLLLHSEDLEVPGVVEFSDEEQIWVATYFHDELRER